MSVKTVWHWGNVAKVALAMVPVIGGTAMVIDWLGLQGTNAGVMLSMAAGAAGALVAIGRWPCWHFE